MLAPLGSPCPAALVISTPAVCAAQARVLGVSSLKKTEARSHYQGGCSICSEACDVWDRGQLFWNRRNTSEETLRNSKHRSVCFKKPSQPTGKTGKSQPTGKKPSQPAGKLKQRFASATLSAASAACYAECGAFCRSERAINHCKLCRCAACAFCKAEGSSNGTASQTTLASPRPTQLVAATGTRGSAGADALASTNWAPSEPAALRAASARRKSLRRPANGTLAWRHVAMVQLAARCARAPATCRERDLYEFGVYTGRSMRAIVLALGAAHAPYRTFWGFDSFQGLPDERDDASSAAAAAPAAPAPYRTVVQRQWHAGAYNAADAMSSHTFGELSSKIRSYILGADGARRGGGAAAAVTAAVDVQWVRGFYEASLTPALARRMRPALYVDFDCDLYSSTYHALDWLATHGLLEAGTILGYDDWSTGGAGGQQRAHAELTAKHYMLVRQLQPLDGHTVRQPCFEVVSIGMLPYYWALLKKRLGWGPPGTGDAAVAIKAARPATPRGAGAPASAGE